MVNTVCAVVCCRREAYPGCGIPFHRIPGHPAVRKKWIETIPGNITTSAVVCGAHFKREDYVEGSKKKLKFGTVPSIFPNCELWLKVVSNNGIVQLPMEEVANLQACHHHKTQYLKEIKHSTSQPRKKSVSQSSDQSDDESSNQSIELSPRIRTKRKRTTTSISNEESFDIHNDAFEENDGASDIGDADEDYEEYQCNKCDKRITGFRYTCVQCVDWDLCGACEANGAHHAHYVLRVPGPRPYKEVKAVLEVIKQQLLKDNILPRDSSLDDRMEEAVFEVPVEAPAPAIKSEPSDSDSDYVADTFDEWLSAEEDKFGLQYQKRRRRSHTDHSVPTKKAKQQTSKSNHNKTLSEIKRAKDERSISKPTMVDYDDIIQKTTKLARTTDDDPFKSPVKTKGTTKTPDSKKNLHDSVSSAEDRIGGNVEDRKVVHLRVPPHTNDEALEQALQSRAYVLMRPLKIAIKKVSEINRLNK